MTDEEQYQKLMEERSWVGLHSVLSKHTKKTDRDAVLVVTFKPDGTHDKSSTAVITSPDGIQELYEKVDELYARHDNIRSYNGGY